MGSGSPSVEGRKKAVTRGALAGRQGIFSGSGKLGDTILKLLVASLLALFPSCTIILCEKKD